MDKWILIIRSQCYPFQQVWLSLVNPSYIHCTVLHSCISTRFDCTLRYIRAQRYRVYSSLQLASPLQKLVRIAPCYLPPGRGDIPALTPAEAGTRFSDPRAMQGWVDLVGWLHTEMVYLPETVTHPSTNRARCRVTSFVFWMMLTTMLHCQPL